VAQRLAYEDGDWFAVPLRADSGFAVGLVARHDGRGGVIGYFFNARWDKLPTVADVTALGPSDVIRVVRFGDLGLIEGRWPVLGKLEDWEPADWPMPVFGRRDISGQAFRVTYPPEDLAAPTREEPISDGECDVLPRDALGGSGAVERVLTALLHG
jgi:Immunity protein 26